MDEFNKNDPFYWNYYILLTAMSSEKMEDGIEKSLYFTKLFFNADNAIIYRQNEIGEYEHVHNQSLMNSNSNITTAILNSAKSILERTDKYEMNPNIDGLHHIAYVKVNVGKQKYVIALTGDKELKNLHEVDTFRHTMAAVLGKYEQIEALSKSAEIDKLTGLRTRNVYEADIKDKKPLEGTIYIFFYLYCLKRINDVYSHQKGDEYISKTTEILKRQFPEYIYTVDPTGKKTKIETGNKLYRVGGDEFILISDTESYQNALYKVMIIQDEVSHIDLNLGTHEILGINYGLLQSRKNDTYRDLYINSNALLEDNKTANYQRLGIERRK